MQLTSIEAVMASCMQVGSYCENENNQQESWTYFLYCFLYWDDKHHKTFDIIVTWYIAQIFEGNPTAPFETWGLQLLEEHIRMLTEMHTWNFVI